MRSIRLSLAITCLVLGTAMAPRLEALEPNVTLVEQVRAAETAFARSMADRDLKTFASFVADDAVFVGTRQVFRGRQAVTAGWKAFFDGPIAPFSWQPDQVEVVASGTLALSSGPVLDPQGQRIGTFKSTWRRDRDGHWRVVLDSGCPACNCPPAANGASGQ